MKNSSANVTSITYAQRGRDILEYKGYNAYFERAKSPYKGVGCGYTIFSNAPQTELERLLRNEGIKTVSSVGDEKS